MRGKKGAATANSDAEARPIGPHVVVRTRLPTCTSKGVGGGGEDVRTGGITNTDYVKRVDPGDILCKLPRSILCETSACSRDREK